MTVRQRGYYLNSLRSLRDRLHSDRIQLIARYGRMVKMEHPDASDQRALICLNARLFEVVYDALRAADGEAVTEDKA